MRVTGMPWVLASVGILFGFQFVATSHIQTQYLHTLKTSDIKGIALSPLRRVSSASSVIHCTQQCIQYERCEVTKFVTAKQLCVLLKTAIGKKKHYVKVLPGTLILRVRIIKSQREEKRSHKNVDLQQKTVGKANTTGEAKNKMLSSQKTLVQTTKTMPLSNKIISPTVTEKVTKTSATLKPPVAPGTTTLKPLKAKMPSAKTRVTYAKTSLTSVNTVSISGTSVPLSKSSASTLEKILMPQSKTAPHPAKTWVPPLTLVSQTVTTESSIKTTSVPSHCHGSPCKCDIGYSLDHTRNQCRILTECSTFSNNFEKYEKMVLWGYNAKIYHFKTAAKCMKKCLKAKSYLCKGVNHDFHVKTCYTKALSWYEAPDYVTRRGVLYHFYQRQCNW